MDLFAGRLIVAENDPLISEGLARSLEGAGLETAAARDAEEALRECGRLRPCVLLIAEELFGRVDRRRFRELADFGRAVRTLVLGGAPDRQQELSYLRLGCAGYLSRRESLETLRKAVKAAAAGEIWARRTVVAQFVRELAEQRAKELQLTRRQREILELIREGRTNEEMENLLYISDETLRWHLRRLYRTIGTVRRRPGAPGDPAAPADKTKRVANSQRRGPELAGKNHLEFAGSDAIRS